MKLSGKKKKIQKTTELSSLDLNFRRNNNNLFRFAAEMVESVLKHLYPPSSHIPNVVINLFIQGTFSDISEIHPNSYKLIFHHFLPFQHKKAPSSQLKK